MFIQIPDPNWTDKKFSQWKKNCYLQVVNPLNIEINCTRNWSACIFWKFKEWTSTVYKPASSDNIYLVFNITMTQKRENKVSKLNKVLNDVQESKIRNERSHSICKIYLTYAISRIRYLVTNSYRSENFTSDSQIRNTTALLPFASGSLLFY